MDENGTLIRLHCPSFKGLDICACDHIPDLNFAAFLGDLSSQSLQPLNESFNSGIGPERFQLHGLLRDVTVRLSLLKGCTNLVSLSLAEGLPETLNNIRLRVCFRDIVAWLEECKNLQTFACNHIPALVELVVSNKSNHLPSLEYRGSEELQTRDSHKRLYGALANQKSLRCLWLNGQGFGQYGPFELNPDHLVDSLSKLVNLKDLRMEKVSKFVDKHAVQLATSLPKLEVWFIRGCRLTNGIWHEVASLGSLRLLEINGEKFSTRGILGFIEKLGPGNRGLSLIMRHKYADDELRGFDEEKIERMIAEKVGGTYMVVRR
ncbi:hypothetical protein MMC29_000956 [Sticta canariensis]|nr:hypothetical protein [Sticta canariensis]